jgi:hypothetical protein
VRSREPCGAPTGTPGKERCPANPSPAHLGRVSPSDARTPPAHDLTPKRASRRPGRLPRALPLRPAHRSAGPGPSPSRYERGAPLLLPRRAAARGCARPFARHSEVPKGQPRRRRSVTSRRPALPQPPPVQVDMPLAGRSRTSRPKSPLTLQQQCAIAGDVDRMSIFHSPIMDHAVLVHASCVSPRRSG